MNEITDIKLENIIPHPDNRRVGGFDQQKLEQFADSIRTIGVQQPAVVRVHPDDSNKYEIVAGERRWRASKLAGLETLPCVIRNIDDITLLKISTIENLQREDIHPLDETDGFQRLVDKAGYDIEMISKEIGKSKPYIYSRLKLLDLIDNVRELFISGKILLGHAITIARLQPQDQDNVVKYINEYRGYQSDEVSISNLKYWIEENIYMELGKTHFKKNDATVLELAGPCTTCPKRTGFSPDLFPDVEEKDTCTDATCLNAKLDIHLKRQLEKLEGEDFVKVAENYLNKVPAGVINSYDWSECKKKDENSQRAIIINGIGRGRLLHVQGRSSYNSTYEPTPEEKINNKIEKLETQRKMDIRMALWNQTMEAIDNTTIEDDKQLEEGLLRMITKKFWTRLGDEYRKKLCKMHNWERPPKENYENPWDRPGFQAVWLEKIDGMNIKALSQFLIEVSLIDELDVNQYFHETPEDNLKWIAEKLNVDTKKIVDEITDSYDQKIVKLREKIGHA